MSASTQDLPDLLAHQPTDTQAILQHVWRLHAEGEVLAAEDVLRSACTASPNAFDLLAAQGDLAAKRQDWILAGDRWLALAKRFPGNPRVITCAVVAMHRQQRYEEVEDLLADVASFETGSQQIVELWARLSRWRADWPEAERRWRSVVERFPASSSHRIEHVTALLKLNDFAGAETVAAAAVERFPADQEIGAVHARVAGHGKNWPEAERRWERLRRITGDRPESWYQQARAVYLQDRAAEAATLLAEAAALFPDDMPIIRLHAEIAGKLGEWVTASALATRVWLANPDGHGLQERAFQTTWRALGMSEVASGPALSPAIAAPPDVPGRLLLHFEAFGADGEFAKVQRHFGCEPQSLLRWAEIGTAPLTAALRAEFEGLGEASNTRVLLGSDFKIRDRRFDFSSHTWVKEDQADHNRFKLEQCRRLKFLCREFLTDVEEGDKILVYRSSKPESLAAVKRLHAAIRKRGQATLLYVQKSDADHSGGTLEAVSEGLLVGYLDNLSDPSTPKIHHADWHALLRKALLMGSPAQASTANDLSLRKLVEQFESLGNNCELGYVQRAAGAEPLGLLRWASTTLPELTSALEQNMAGVGDPENTEIYTDGDYRVVDPRYGLEMQTFVTSGQVSRDGLLIEHGRRARRLRGQLLADLRAGQKIFVHKTTQPPGMEEVFALHAAMRRFGPSGLLHVRPAEPGSPGGTLREAAPGLWVAHMDRLVAPAGGGWDVANDSWLEICRGALEAFQLQR